MFMQGVWPIRPDMARMVGIAFTMRFIPSREDKDGPGAPGRGTIQSKAMETCPSGHVLVVDSRGDARAASAGDIYVGRLKARGCAGIVTDGGLRDSDGVAKTGLVAYLRRPSSPPSGIVHQPVDLGLPIACGGVAVYPGDVIVGDADGVVVIPPDIVATPPSLKPPSPRRSSNFCANTMARWGRSSPSSRVRSTNSRATGSWCSSMTPCRSRTRPSARSRWRRCAKRRAH